MKNLRPSAKVDAQGIITEVNQDYLDLLGYSLDEMLNQPIQNFRTNDFPKLIQEDLKAVLTQGLPYHGYVIEKNHSGADVYLSMTLFPQGSAGNYQGYTSVNRLLPQKKRRRLKHAFSYFHRVK